MLKNAFLAVTAASFMTFAGTAIAQQITEPEYFSAVSDTDEGVQSAADFAVETRSNETGEVLELVQIVEASESTAPGVHYRLSLVALDNGQTRRAFAEVTGDSDGSMSLSEWVWQTAESD